MDVSDVITSRTSFQVLALLCSCREAIALREISRHLNLPVHSVENSLASLERLGVVVSKRVEGRRWSELNAKYPLISLLREMFRPVIEWRFKSELPNYDAKARQVLAFCDSTRALIRKGKSRGPNS